MFRIMPRFALPTSTATAKPIYAPAPTSASCVGFRRGDRSAIRRARFRWPTPTGTTTKNIIPRFDLPISTATEKTIFARGLKTVSGAIRRPERDGAIPSPWAKCPTIKAGANPNIIRPSEWPMSTATAKPMSARAVWRASVAGFLRARHSDPIFWQPHGATPTAGTPNNTTRHCACPISTATAKPISAGATMRGWHVICLKGRRSDLNSADRISPTAAAGPITTIIRRSFSAISTATAKTTSASAQMPA